MSEAIEISSAALLQQLSKEDEQAIISLPYRVGLYISQCDQTGGMLSDSAELFTLINILRGFSEDFCKSEFVQEVLVVSLGRRDSWEKWNKNLDAVPEECKQALAILNGILDDKETGSLKEILMDIGMAVAMAFRETGAEQETSAAKPLGMVSKAKQFVQSLTGRAGEPNPFRHMNISPAEERALQALAQALDYKF